MIINLIGKAISPSEITSTYTERNQIQIKKGALRLLFNLHI